MSIELKNLKSPGTYQEVLFFIRDILGSKELTEKNIELLCAHSPSTVRLAYSDILDFCILFSIVDLRGELYSINSDYKDILSNEEVLEMQIITNIIKYLFENKVFNPSMFEYDITRDTYIFKNHLLPLFFSGIRNFLTTTDFFDIKKTDGIISFFIGEHYSDLIEKAIKDTRKTFTLDQLKKQIEEDEVAGEKAELFVVQYEKNRLCKEISDKVKRISEIDVTAGYDIISFNDDNSCDFDRFIEVKAVTKECQFFWSRNEYEAAKIIGEKYFLYLVNLSKVENPEYMPIIMQNPAKDIMENDGWLVETQNYRVIKI